MSASLNALFIFVFLNLMLSECSPSPMHHSVKVMCNDVPILPAHIYIFHDNEQLTYHKTDKHGVFYAPEFRNRNVDNLNIKIRHNCTLPHGVVCNLPYNELMAPVSMFHRHSHITHVLELADKKYEHLMLGRCI